MYSRQLPAMVMFLLALLWPAVGRSETITTAMRAEDTRLSTLVTLNEPQISIGELLEKLSQQTGITLTTNPREPASSRKIFLCCDKKPVGAVMDALWSLLSYQPGLWKWERSGKQSAFRYEFAPTLAATHLPQTLKDLSQQVFLDHVKTMLAFAAMSPEERKNNVTKLSGALMQKDDKIAQDMVDKDGFTWNCLNAFMDALTPQQQQVILHGGRFPVTLDKMPEEARKAFHQAWSWYNPRHKLSDGQIVPYPEPSTVYFESRGGHFAMRELLPCLYIDMGDVGSLSVLGTEIEPGYRDKIRDMWMLPGDHQDSMLTQRVCTRPQDLDVLPLSRPQNDDELRAAIKQGRAFSSATATPMLQIRFGQLARSVPVMVIGLLPAPAYQPSDPGSPYNQVAQAFLQRAVSGRLRLMTKWRGDALLVSYPTWFLYEEENVSYAIVQQMKRADRNGFVPFAVLAEIAGKVTQDQWRDLCHNEAMQAMEGAYPVLQFCCRYPLMLKSGGVGISEDVMQTLHNLPPLDRIPMLFDGKARALRVVPVMRKGEKTSAYEMLVQYQNAQREWRPLVGFTQVKGQ